MLARLVPEPPQPRRTARHLRVARCIARCLEETGRAPLEQIVRTVQYIGEERALTFLERTLAWESEHAGEVRTAGERSPRGGVYFQLIREAVDRETCRVIFVNRRGRHQAVSVRPYRPTHRPAQGSPRETSDRGDGAGGTRAWITVVGRPELVEEWPDAVILSLPGLPLSQPDADGATAPSPPFLVIVDRDRWREIAADLSGARENWIIEGVPHVGWRDAAIALFCTHISPERAGAASAPSGLPYALEEWSPAGSPSGGRDGSAGPGSLGS